MSLYIDVDKITAVLIADTWYTVLEQSFDLDAYEYHHNDVTLNNSGGTGFRFSTPARSRTLAEAATTNHVTPEWMVGPLSSIQAVRYGRE